MTPDSPKGPEQSDWEPLYGFCAEFKHDNVALAKTLESIRRKVCAYGGHGRCDCKYGRDVTQSQRAGSEQTGCPELVEVIHRLLHRPESFAPELERLTAEVERLTGRLESSDNLMREFQRVAEVFRAEKREALAEVSRLREQLAAAVVLPKDARHRIWSVLFVCAKEGDPPNATALSVLNLVQSWGVSSSEVEAPQPQEMEQHEVRSHGFCGDRVHMKCVTCGEFRCESQEQAEDWKDQHEADTLVPQLQANSKLEQNLDEGRPSGSKRLAPRSDEELLQRLRSLVADLQNPCTGTKGEAYDSGFLDGQIQAGNDVEALLDEFAPVAAQAARSEATPRVWTSGDPEPIEPGLTIRSYDDVTWFRRPNGQWTGSAGWAFGSWSLLLDAEGTLTEVLDESSPSLRKEGEDK